MFLHVVYCIPGFGSRELARARRDRHCTTAGISLCPTALTWNSLGVSMEGGLWGFIDMISKPVRILALACSLLLALPPGWCCVLKAYTLGQVGKKTQQICESCCHNQPAKDSKPNPSPPSPRPGKCPCDDRNSTSADSTSAKSDCAVALPAVCDPAGSLMHLPAIGVELPIAYHSFSNASLHLIHCIWLC